jgi:hypothetical protein
VKRCSCAECQRLDRWPRQGIVDTFQLAFDFGPPFDRYWRIRVNLPDRFGARCRILARGKMNSCWIEFEDGVQHIVSRNSIRKIRA